MYFGQISLAGQDSLDRRFAPRSQVYSGTGQTDTTKSRARLSLIQQRRMFMLRIQSKQQGQGLSEYLVIVGLIAVASIAAVGFLGGTVRSQVAAILGSAA